MTSRLFSYFKNEKKPLLIVTFSGLLYNLGMVAGPWFEGQLAQRLYDISTGQKAFSDMLRLALIYAGIILFVQFMRFLKRFYVRRFANNVSRRMKRDLYHCLIYMSRPELTSENAGSLMTKAVSDVDTCVEGMRKFTTEVFDTGVVMIAYLAMLMYYDWRIAIISCIFPPLAYVIAEKMKKAIYRCSTAMKESTERLNTAALDRISNALMYRIHGQESTLDTRYETHLEDYERSAVRANIWQTAMQPLYQMISMAGILFILWFGGKNVLGTGWQIWNIAAFTTFLSCFTKLAVKSSKAAKLFNAVQKAAVSWKRIAPLLKGREIPSLKTKDLTESDTASKPSPKILRLRDVSFAYPSGTAVLKHLTFDLRPGSCIGITGPVACGKSTLGKLFLNEHPYIGSIHYGLHELSAMPPADINRSFSYMGHDPELIDGTIEENVLLGDDKDAMYFLKMVCMDQDIAAMPEGIQTRIGCGGLRLSGGQQARLALARTLCHHGAVLILDDPFSAVDRITEQQIMHNLRTALSECTLLLISHRLYLFPETDQILWMENGQVFSDTHDSLLESCTAYADIYQTQQKGGLHHE